MSARKLQQEIDKLNKKIFEGLSLFDDIKDKIATADVQSQREKMENDLKKELKKLQRSRDQLKQWLGDSSIKLDKSLIQENRTKIEHAMDQFKELEKSSKIKQFSNEGLELQQKTKKNSKYGDDVKYQETVEYISGVIEQLQTQNEELDQELDQLNGQVKKSKGSSVQQSIDDIKYKMERNNQHIERLEEILDHLENDRLDPAKVDNIRDDIDYYVEMNQDEDYVEYDEFYDQLELDDNDDEDLEVEGSLAQMATESIEEQERKQEEERKAHEKHADDSMSEHNNTISKSHSNSSQPTHSHNNTNSSPEPKSSSTINSSTPVKKKTSITPAPAPPPIIMANSYSNVIKAAQQAATASQPPVKQAQTPPVNNNTPTKLPPPGFSHIQQQEPVSSSASKSPSVSPTFNQSKLTDEHQHHHQQQQPDRLQSQSPMISNENKSFDDTISRIINIAHSRLNNPLPIQSVHDLLENSLLNCPDSFDAEKPRQYTPVNVHPSSIDYPQEPMYELNNLNYMKKFDNDTLFFCFYYSGPSDNLARYNAARELSHRGWVFNTEFNQWFKKDNKPKNRSLSTIQRESDSESKSSTPEPSLNDDTNNANEIDELPINYKYFDYEKTWLTRRRENYKFPKEIRQSYI